MALDIHKSATTNSPKPLLEALLPIEVELEPVDRVVVALDFRRHAGAHRPDSAAVSVPREVRDAIAQLAASSRFSVAIVSGRSVADVRRKMDDLNVVYAGNHGLEIEGGGISFLHQRAEWLRTTVDHACWNLAASLEFVQGVHIEGKGLSATVHFRQAPGELNSWIETTVRTILGGLPELSVRPAREALDILPRTVWTKGSVIKLLVKQTRAARAAVICAGDDTTDEDVFDAVPGAISIRVDSVQATRARYYLSGPLELLRFLKWLGPDKAAIGELPSMATKESTPTRRPT